MGAPAVPGQLRGPAVPGGTAAERGHPAVPLLGRGARGGLRCRAAVLRGHFHHPLALHGAESAVPRDAVVDQPRLRPAGLRTAPSPVVSGRLRLRAPDPAGRLAERRHFSLLHLRLLAGPEDADGVREHRHGVRHVRRDAAGPPGVLPVRPALAPRQPLPERGPVRLGVFGLQVARGPAHLRHDHLCPAGVRPVALPAAEAEGERPRTVRRGVCGSVRRRGGRSGLPVAGGSRAPGPGLGERHVALPAAAGPTAGTQGQHPGTLGRGRDPGGTQPLRQLRGRAKGSTRGRHFEALLRVLYGFIYRQSTLSASAICLDGHDDFLYS